MRTIPDQLKSRNLVPFKKRNGRYNIPGMASENEVLMDRVDTDLSPEEQGFIRHYLGYADTLLQSTEYIVPQPLEGAATQNGSEEVTEQATDTKNPNSKVA
ncbi:MAG TPA: hypothetical protein VGR76_20190 [Candidatus Angelobacter sp.]|nr:hypothetical protein [Candidatus Angelobacter sp.]